MATELAIPPGVAIMPRTLALGLCRTIELLNPQPNHRVLLTRGLSSVRDAVAWLRQDAAPGELTLLASYITSVTPLQHVADRLLAEPEGSPDRWLAWLAETVRAEHVDLVWPQAWLKTLLHHPTAVAALGVPVLLPCRDSATYYLFQDKAACHVAMSSRLRKVPLPWQTVATGAAEVRAAIIACRDQGMVPCVKPRDGMYGLGFRVLDTGGSSLRRILSNDTYSISESDLLSALAADANPPAVLVMEYLAGEERSMDVLAWQGDLLACVIRRKASESGGRWQAIEADGPSEAIARRVVREFSLHGLVNIQTRERILESGERQPCFLEANLRMSGGIARSCAGGLNLPLWAVRLALGTARPHDVPSVASYGQVATYEVAVRVAEAWQ